MSTNSLLTRCKQRAVRYSPMRTNSVSCGPFPVSPRRRSFQVAPCKGKSVIYAAKPSILSLHHIIIYAFALAGRYASMEPITQGDASLCPGLGAGCPFRAYITFTFLPCPKNSWSNYQKVRKNHLRDAMWAFTETEGGRKRKKCRTFAWKPESARQSGPSESQK